MQYYLLLSDFLDSLIHFKYLFSTKLLLSLPIGLDLCYDSLNLLLPPTYLSIHLIHVSLNLRLSQLTYMPLCMIRMIALFTEQTLMQCAVLGRLFMRMSLAVDQVRSLCDLLEHLD